MNKGRFRVYTLSADIAILTLSYIFMTMLKPAGLKAYVPSHLTFFIVLALLWLIVSVVSGKIGRGHIINLRTLFSHVLASNLTATGIAALLLFASRDLGYSRQVVFGTALTATFLELVFGTLYLAFRKAPQLQPAPELLTEREMVARAQAAAGETEVTPDPQLTIRLQEGCSRERAEALSAMISTDETSRLAIVSTGEAFNIQNLEKGDYTCIINLKPINSIRKLDRFLDTVNGRLGSDGIFLCSVETLEQRAQRLRQKYSPVIYFLIAIPDFFINRVTPRLRITRGLWEFFTGSANPPFSRAEALGRLCRAGFSIRQERFAGNMLCVKAQRKTEPAHANGNGYGFIIALPRVGRDGQLFNVYKLRTMHPYSEYIQDYIYDIHDLAEGGKLKHDFRVTTWGRFARRVWLDELPMLYNIIRGDIKIFGVRPLSNHYFSLYSDDIRDRRIQYKPGLLPPYYADMPAGLDAIQLSEKKYFDSWDKNPVGTDIRYFARSVYNIVFRSARSA
ncbi:MAG: sugar transferase [Bacteroidales bacterium]|nr:sugar transferase [Bacteroidales bacterium]